MNQPVRWFPRRRAGPRQPKRANSYGLPMDFLWTPYGLPMDSLWNNTVATPKQYRNNTVTARGIQRTRTQVGISGFWTKVQAHAGRDCPLLLQRFRTFLPRTPLAPTNCGD